MTQLKNETAIPEQTAMEKLKNQLTQESNFFNHPKGNIDDMQHSYNSGYKDAIDTVIKEIDLHHLTKELEGVSAGDIAIDLRNESALYAKRQGSHDNPDTTAHDFFEGAQFGVTYASQLHPVSKSEGVRPVPKEKAIDLITGALPDLNEYLTVKKLDTLCKWIDSYLDKYTAQFPAPVSKDALTQAEEFAEWIGEQGLFNGLSPDNIRRWHKMVGNSNAVTIHELYTQFKNQKQ